MQIDPRSREILIGLIAEYIKTGRPISSVHIRHSLDLKVSTATIRNHLHELEEKGYIYQPHTSAGRIPTDKGYRFFVNHVQKRALADIQRQRLAHQFARLLQAQQHVARITAGILSQLSGAVAVTAVADPLDIHESGFRNLINSPQQQSLEQLQEVAKLIEKLDNALPDPAFSGAQQATVYIGNEIPFMPAEHSSVIVRGTTTPEGNNVTLVLIGSKRMPYQRNAAIMDTIATIIKET